jgi:hypothetical protein
MARFLMMWWCDRTARSIELVEAAVTQGDGAVSIKLAPFRALFILAVTATYCSVLAGALGILNANLAAIVGLAASTVAALSALAFSVLWNREWRRKHAGLSPRRG